MKTCTIDWCEKQNHWRWCCKMHYARRLKYWDTSILHKTGKKILWLQPRKSDKLYSIYKWMRCRCYYIKHKNYKNYWWRGIIVCDRWLWLDWFTNFCNDLWQRPEWYSLDRIDVNWNYEPNNCRRATYYEQARNKRNNNKVVWVSRHKTYNRRVASIYVWKRVWLWTYKNYEDAVKSRKDAEIKYKIYW